MIDTHGGVQHVELAPQLWCVVFFPFLAAVAISYFGLTLGSASEKEKLETTQTVSRIAVAGPFAALLTALYYAFALSQLGPNSRFFLLHFANLLRIGQFDANVDFAFDPLAATFAIVIAALGACVALLLGVRATQKPKESSWQHFARLNACIAAALFFVMADNFPLALVGWGATGALASSLVISKTESGARARRISFVASRFGDAAFLVAAASLFWSFGGAFAEGDYIPDLDARYAAVSNIAAANIAPGHASSSAKASVTLASTPGALLFVDESHAPLENSGSPARAPEVRQTVDAGMHTFRVHPGSGLDDSIIAHVRFVEGAEVALVLVGASTNFREMRDQLVLTDDRGSTWRKDALVGRRAFGSLGAVTFACLLTLIAAAIRGAAVPFEAWLAGATESSLMPTAVLVQGVAACTGIYLLARVSFLFELSPAASSIAAAIGAISALGAACAAVASSTTLRFIGHLAAAQFGFALLAFGVGSPIDAVVLVAISSFAIAALALASAAKNESSSRVAIYALAVAPIPGVGVSFAVIRALGAALVSDRVVGIPGALLVAFGAAAAIALGFASRRWLQITFPEGGVPSGRKKDDKKPVKSTKKTSPAEVASLEQNVVFGLVGAAIALGLIFDLGVVSGHPFTSDASWLASWLTPSLLASTAHESSAVDALVFALGFGGALAGFAHARNRGTKKGALEKIDPRLESWEKSRAADGGLIARVASSLTERASLLARDTDRFVIDGVIGAAAGIIRFASRLTGGRG